MIYLFNRNVPNVSQPVSESANNEVVKKKHKKHKKDKKNKKQKHSSPPPPTIDRFLPVTGPPVLELPDSLSSNSMSLFAANTSDSMKDQQQQHHQQQHHLLTNSTAYSNSMGISLPSTSINSSATVTATPTKTALWTPGALKSNDLTFTGKFTKTDDNIINIDSSSGSNSPKYVRTQSPIMISITSRSSSPSRLNLLPIKSTDYGSRIATDEENSSTHVSLLQQQTESSLARTFGDSSVQVKKKK